MTRTPDQIRTDILNGGARRIGHVDAGDRAMTWFVSIADPRISFMDRWVRRTGRSTRTFKFADSDVDVDVVAGSPIITDEGRYFATLEELCVAVAAHDRAVEREREWRDAAPAIQKQVP